MVKNEWNEMKHERGKSKILKSLLPISPGKYCNVKRVLDTKKTYFYCSLWWGKFYMVKTNKFEINVSKKSK